MTELKRAIVEANTKLDKVSEDISEIKIIQAAQASDLKHHIYRTDLAEEHLRRLEADFKPIQKHVTMINGGLKFLGAITAAASLIVGFAKIILELF